MAEFCGSACANAVGTLMVHYIVKPMVRPVVSRIRYCFRFRKIVEELHRQENNLIKEKTLVQAEIEEAGLHIETQEIEECVYEWCKNAENVLNEVKGLDRRIGEDEKCYCSCPDWKWRYTLSKEIEKRTLDIGELVKGSNFKLYGRPGKLPDLALAKSKDHMYFKSSDAAFNKIMEAVQDDNVTKMGVWGMGGVGKTTLVKKVGRQVLNGFDQVIMATVSRTPSITEIQNKIADLIKNFHLEAKTVEVRASELLNRLERGRFLIILDDLWNEWNDEDDLRQIGIPLLKNGKGCKVILTTRRRTVCVSMKCDVTFPIDVLEDEEAWTLFRMKANLADDEARGRDFIEEARKVARECQGLPVAIVTLASALKGTKTRKEWQVARKNLENSRINEVVDVEEEEDKDKNAYSLTEDHLIDVEDLVRYALALELYGKFDSVEQLRWKVFKDIDYLMDSCLLLKVEDNEVKYENNKRNVKLHDIVRDVALWIASKRESGFVINSGLELLNESSEYFHAISLLNNESKKIPESFVQSSKLEILLLRNCELPGTCVQWMKNLKVLSLTYEYNNRVAISLYALKYLKNLRALHLKSFHDVSFLGDLKTLEIFSLGETEIWVKDLAKELVRLENLKILDLFPCFLYEPLPSYVIEKLTRLEELYLQGSKITAEILVAIHLSPRLTALSLSLDSDVIRNDYVFPKSLARYDISIKDRHGSRYHLTEKSWEIEVPGIPYYLASLLSEDLECLVLESNIDEFMEVLLGDKSLKLSNLKILHLQQKTGSQLSRLRELPNQQQVRLEGLVDLKIVNIPNLKSVFPLSVAQNLVVLETLEIRECNGLEQIVTELEGNDVNSQSPLLCFPKLNKLRVGNCDGLEYIFPTLMAPQGLQSLTDLSIEKCRRLKQLIRLAKDDDLGHQQLILLRCLPSFSVSDCPLFTDSVVRLEPARVWLKEVRLSAFKESFSTSKQLTLVAIEDVECLVDNTLSTENGPTSSALFTNLEILIIEKIDGLKTLCKGDQPPQGFLKNLKQLDIGDCNKLQVVLYNKKENEVSNLQSLKLYGLPELRCIFKDSAHSFTLQSLKVVNIRRCWKLESVFSTSLIQSLELLEDLVIEDCDALKTLFSELENDGEIGLPKLKKLSILDCPKLEYVVPITNLDQGLPALASLSVSRCGELKQVFSMPNGNHGGEHNRILQLLLPSLEDLELDSLDKLTSFVPENYIVKAPALKSIYVGDCHRLMKFPIQQVKDQLNLAGVLLSSAFKDLLCNTKHLNLDHIGGPQNLVPQVIGIEYMEGLTSLEICVSNDVECLVDSTSTEALMMGSKYNKGHQPPKLLSSLEHLQVTEANGLRWMVKGSSKSNCVNFKSLKVLRIKKCIELEYLFPPSVLQTLWSLEEIEIEFCNKLKSLFMEYLESDDDDDDEIGMESSTLCLPNLKTVKIINCYSLEYVFPHALAQGLQNLKTVEIDECTSLRYVFSHALALGFPCLQKLHLVGVGNLTSIVRGNNFLEAPAMEILCIVPCSETITNFTIRNEVNYCIPVKELTIIWKSELRQIRSPNFECRTHFEQLFEPQGTGGYFFLSTREKIHLSGLIWLRDIWKAPPIHVATINLRQLQVSHCNNLTRIFPVKLVPHLTQLSSLIFYSCEKLKQIIANDDDDDEGVQLMEMKMVFPQLNEIQLSNLSSLESFSPAGYHLEFPCLEFLDVKNCSKMKTSFSVDYITLTVHAKTHQASQLGEDTSSSTEHIRWSINYPTLLPQYVEEAEEISPLN